MIVYFIFLVFFAILVSWDEGQLIATKSVISAVLLGGTLSGMVGFTILFVQDIVSVVAGPRVYFGYRDGVSQAVIENETYDFPLTLRNNGYKLGKNVLVMLSVNCKKGSFNLIGDGSNPKEITYLNSSNETEKKYQFSIKENIYPIGNKPLPIETVFGAIYIDTDDNGEFLVEIDSRVMEEVGYTTSRYEFVRLPDGTVSASRIPRKDHFYSYYFL